MANAVLVSIRGEVARRTRKVQQTFLLPEPESSAGAEATPRPSSPWNGPPPHRAALAKWPDEWRARWGRRANALEDEGLAWHEAESRAFVEVWNERRARNLGAESLARMKTERNE